MFQFGGSRKFSWKVGKSESLESEVQSLESESLEQYIALMINELMTLIKQCQSEPVEGHELMILMTNEPMTLMTPINQCRMNQ